MDFEDSPEEVAMRVEARAWLDGHAVRMDGESLSEMRTYRAHTEEEDAALVHVGFRCIQSR